VAKVTQRDGRVNIHPTRLGAVGHNGGVQDAFGIVLIVVVAVAAIVAVVTFLGSGRAYEQIGRGGLSLRDESDRPAPEPLSAGGVRNEEIRQMLEARNARRVRRGEEPLDVEAELSALTRPAVDPTLALEIRQLVEARNARRLRQGREPLDVEAEVERRLRELAEEG
jgi:hypothetical protein